ncbi:MAG: RIP metalloprotease RseP [Herminiimonas sp.]|nr:RIP metalloprotease RseP [Herminiimonas sp.]
MNLIQTVLAFLVVIATLIVVHELGHYLVARWCGVKVLRFSVGMGKVLFSRRFGRDQTEWVVSMLPLGGYVKMLDAREGDLAGVSPTDLKREFTSQSVWRRISIVAAGPIANFLLAIAVFAGLYMHGIPEPVPKLRAVPVQSPAGQAGLRGGELITGVDGESIQIWSDLRWKLIKAAIEKRPATIQVRDASGGSTRTVTLAMDSIGAADLETDFVKKLGIELARRAPVLGKLVPEGPGMRAGLQEGDRILAIDGVPMLDGQAFVDRVRTAAGQSLKMNGLRNGMPFDVVVVPEKFEQGGQTIGRIQVDMSASMTPEMIVASDAPLTAVTRAVRKTWDTSVMTIRMVGKMLIGEASIKNITGPITIADYAGQTARLGLISYLSFIAFISISLGVMNLLPIPVLDGGLLLYYSLEVLTGRPVSQRVGEIAQRAGLGVLMMLMFVAVFNDIVRLMS